MKVMWDNLPEWFGTRMAMMRLGQLLREIPSRTNVLCFWLHYHHENAISLFHCLLLCQLLLLLFVVTIFHYWSGKGAESADTNVMRLPSHLPPVHPFFLETTLALLWAATHFYFPRYPIDLWVMRL